MSDGGVLILGETQGSLPKAVDQLRRLALELDLRFQTVTIEPGSPAVVIRDLFNLDIPRMGLINAHGILATRELAGACVLLEGIGGKQWEAWRPFLIEFQHACRELRPEDRPVLCAVLAASEALEIQGADINLTLELLDAHVSVLDLLEYALHRFITSNVKHPLLYASVAASISQWDIPLMEDILDNPERSCLTDPVAFLQEIARGRGWDAGLEPDIRNGGMHPHTKKIHSCFLSLNDIEMELQSRLWRGQIGYVLPHIEDYRRKYLPEISRHIPLPVRVSPDGPICDSHLDMEVGVISFHLKRNPNAPRNLVRRFDTMQKCRNGLAHLEPLSTEMLRQVLD